MNDLKEWFDNNSGRRINKWSSYFEVYERHLSRFRHKPMHLLELGVSQGGSLQMWKSYFGSQCNVFGIDINPECKRFEETGTTIFIGDQDDRQFLKSVANELPEVDVIIDDGGHTMTQQIRTFEELFPKLATNGVYICEDCHTSYWKKFGGGFRKKGTFIEYTKNLIDYLNAWHSKTARLQVTEFTKSARSIHFYDSMVVIEKAVVEKPENLKTGDLQIPNYHPPKRWDKRVTTAIKKFLRKK